MVGHGAGKLFGAFNAGYGIEGTAGFLESLDFRPGKPWAYLHGAAELGAGVGITTGALTPLAGSALIGVMATAARTAHKGKGPWSTSGGWELPLTLGAVGGTLGFTGPGKYSVDRAVGLNQAGPRWGLLTIVLGLGSAAAALALRRPPTTAPAQTDTAEPKAAGSDATAATSLETEETSLP
jgi:putative oxidoreductase